MEVLSVRHDGDGKIYTTNGRFQFEVLQREGDVVADRVNRLIYLALQAKESPSHSTQQLKAEIANVAESLQAANSCHFEEEIAEAVSELRQLSAI